MGFKRVGTIFQLILITKNEQKKMNDTKYAYAIDEPQVSSPFFAFESHGFPFRQANIMFGHASPVAHLNGVKREI